MSRKSILTMWMLICLLGQFAVTTLAQTLDFTTSPSSRNSRLISFDTNSGKIDINLDLSVPFLSIPLDDKKEGGGPPMPLLNINTKALAVFGVIMAMSAFVVPLLVKKIPEGTHEAPANLHHHHYGKEHKRSDRGIDLWNFGDSLNEILFRDSRVTPCVQSIVCTAVATASRSDSQTSADKIIDGLSSLKWFDQTSNGTVIKESVARGRDVSGPDECIETYKGCVLNQQVVANMLKIIGI